MTLKYKDSEKDINELSFEGIKDACYLITIPYGSHTQEGYLLEGTKEEWKTATEFFKDLIRQTVLATRDMPRTQPSEEVQRYIDQEIKFTIQYHPHIGKITILGK